MKKPSKLKILAFCGKSFSGKSRAACIVKAMDDTFKIRSLSALVKCEFSIAFGVDMALLESELAYKQVLLEYHMYINKKDPGHFSQQLVADLTPEDFIVIDDLHFIEDMAYLIKRGSAVYKLSTDSKERGLRGHIRNLEVDSGIAECELDLSSELLNVASNGHGGVIWNNSSLENLSRQLIIILRDDFGKQDLVPVI